MIFLNRFVGLEQPLDWAAATDSIVVTVEYRLGPTAQQPALVNDCYAGLVWIAENAENLSIDPARIMVAGHSGGGGLAAGVALMARDRSGPAICAQLLACPMLDDRNMTASACQFDDTEPWDRKSNVAAWEAVLGSDAGGDNVCEYFAPGRAKCLEGLAPAWIDVGSAEVFRDEAVAYATKCWAAGVQAELHVWAGGFHGFDMMAPASALAIQAASVKLNWIKRMLCR
jgi:acetyl esterase/lipase